MKYERDPD